ncbi:hypothetical protein Prudu_012630 [Prunus dulcis]|uniref:CCHC-type domain-containing protein n=1 Tax=Prunus dulcis TaxID=3755 RepID=A0A4Y1RDU7_PRUDU|nr:hypothetical protein Prudu_012630 [Prunus dulcis]
MDTTSLLPSKEAFLLRKSRSFYFQEKEANPWFHVQVFIEKSRNFKRSKQGKQVHRERSLLTYSLKILFYLPYFFIFPMASSSDSAVAFPSVSQAIHIKLDRNNYPLWLAQILPLLKSRNLMSFINSAVVAPSPFLQDDKGKLTDDINPAYDTWIQQDQLVLSWINGSLSSTVLVTVARFTSARSTWVALENRFASPNQNRILQLRSELFRTARGDSSVADYLDKVNAIVDNLALSGSPLPDSDLLAVIMNNVGPLYESTIASTQARETPITYADLEALLLSAEQRHLALHAPARDGPATAMVAAHGRAPSRGRGRGSGRFFFRGGHSGGSGSWLVLPLLLDLLGFAALPPLMVLVPGVLGPHPVAAAGFSSPSAPFSGSRIQCQICGRYGHSALDCYNRLNLSYEGRVPTQRLTAMTAQQSSSPRPPNWVVDTGANSHITNDLSNLSLSREYHGHDSVDGVLGGTGFADGEDSFPGHDFGSTVSVSNSSS